MALDNTHMWVTVSLVDGMIYEGTVTNEAPYGIYLCIGGNEDRLTLFPWHAVSRIIYKNPLDL